MPSEWEPGVFQIQSWSPNAVPENPIACLGKRWPVRARKIRVSRRERAIVPEIEASCSLCFVSHIVQMVFVSTDHFLS